MLGLFGLHAGCGLLDLQYGTQGLQDRLITGAEWSGIRADLVSQGYRPATLPVADSARSAWTDCLSRQVGAFVALAGGTRFVCVRLDDTGRIQEARAVQQVVGV